MNKPSIDVVLQQGMYGPKQTKPDERRRFLGTLRERIIVALMKSQVKEQEIYPQVEQLMKKHPESMLFLNGNIEYALLSKYLMLAKKYKIEQRIVTNKEFDTEIGLVLGMKYAIDKEEIYLHTKELPAPQKKEKASVFKKWFKRR